MANQKFSTLHAANDFPYHQEIRRKRRVTCFFIIIIINIIIYLSWSWATC
jgi:t-SNARE complex subunit (syntaxin)